MTRIKKAKATIDIHWLSFEFPKPIPLQQTLIDIIDNQVDESYYLSNKACEKIMERFKSRGKILIGSLSLALQGKYKGDKKVFSIDSMSSNSMKSKNPYSGYRECLVSRCIDTADPNPSKNQGGLLIVDEKH